MRDARGFSLLEALVATTLLVGAVGALAHLCALSLRANRGARTTTYTALLAQQKLEQLRGLAFGFDALGGPVTDTDTDTTVDPGRAGGVGLSSSPTGSLSTDTPGYCDYVDANGRSLGGGTSPPTGAVYVRRWSVAPLATSPDNAIVLQVLAARLHAGSAGRADGTGARLPDEAHVVTARTRRSS